MNDDERLLGLKSQKRVSFTAKTGVRFPLGAPIILNIQRFAPILAHHVNALGWTPILAIAFSALDRKFVLTGAGKAGQAPPVRPSLP